MSIYNGGSVVNGAGSKLGELGSVVVDNGKGNCNLLVVELSG